MLIDKVSFLSNRPVNNMSDQAQPESSVATSTLPDTDDHPLTGRKESDIIVMFRLVPHKGDAPVPFTYITNFLNHHFGRMWTSKQVLHRFLELRQDYNSKKEEDWTGNDPYHCFFRWDKQYRDDTVNKGLKKFYDEGQAAFEKDFEETWSDEEDAVFSMTEEEIVCEDVPEQVLNSTSFFKKCMGNRTLADKWLDRMYEGEGPCFFRNPKGSDTTQDNINNALKRAKDFDERRRKRLEEMRRELKRHVGQPRTYEFYGMDPADAYDALGNPPKAL